jgi:polar amino acid transport system substrate-binding protein
MPNFPCFSMLVLLFGIVSGAFAETFTLGAEDQAGPWGQSDGTGCGNDIVRAAYAASGDSVILKILPYVQAKKLTFDGELVGCFSMAWEEKFEGYINFAERPLYVVECTFVAKKGRKANFFSLDQMPAGATLGIVTGYEYPSVIRNAGGRGIKIEESSSEEQNLRKLAAGRIDATVLQCDPLKTLHVLINKAGVNDKIDSCCTMGIMASYIGFNSSEPGGMRAKSSFDRGMKIIQDNGVYNTILKKWKSNVSRSSVSKRPLVYMCESIPPSNYVENGTLKGASIELLRLIWNKLGIPEQPVEVVPWARGYYLLQTRENQVLFSMTRTAERDSLFKWVGPIFTVHNMLIGRADKPIRIQTLDAAKKYRIGTIKDDVLEKYLLTSNFDTSRIEGVSTLEKNFEKLRLGRIDLIAQPAATFREFLKMKKLDSNQFRICYELSEGPNYFAFSNDVGDDIVQGFQNALESLKPEHELILAKYGQLP